MSNYDMKIHSNPEAKAWAKFFIQTKKEKSWQIEDIDETLMLAWFANAMMAMHDHLKSQRTWVGLTDVEIDYLLVSTAGENEETHISFARAIESKLKEINT
jgi:hypothetical protein